MHALPWLAGSLTLSFRKRLCFFFKKTACNHMNIHGLDIYDEKSSSLSNIFLSLDENIICLYQSLIAACYSWFEHIQSHTWTVTYFYYATSLESVYIHTWNLIQIYNLKQQKAMANVSYILEFFLSLKYQYQYHIQLSNAMLIMSRHNW